MNKLAHFFLDVDLRCSHTGLYEIIRKKKIKIGEGEFVVFMNQKRTMIKMFCQGKNALLHYKNDDARLDPGIIQHLPKYCGGDELNVEGAIRENLLNMMNRRRKRNGKS